MYTRTIQITFQKKMVHVTVLITEVLFLTLDEIIRLSINF